MRGARPFGLIAAVALSGGAHLAASGFFTPEMVELDGGGEPAPARLGSSFADMVQGMPGIVRPDVTDPVDIEEAAQDPVRVLETETSSDADTAEVADPDAAELREPDTAEASPPEITEPTRFQEMARPAIALEAIPTDIAVGAAPVPVEASTIAAVPVQPAPQTAAQPAPASAPAAVQRTASTSPADVMVADDEAALTPPSSPRPRARPEGLAPPPPPPEPEVAAPRPQPQPQAPAATGSAAANATRGSTTGSEATAATATAPAPQPAPQAGNGAALANYPGEVLRRISRAGRPRVRHTGPDVVISFRVSSGGGLTGLSIASSSGNLELDQAGLSIVQRAAPFPAPPPGAQTRFSINFGGR